MMKRLLQKKRLLIAMLILALIMLSGTQVMAQIHHADSMNCAMICNACAPTIPSLNFRINHGLYLIETAIEYCPAFSGAHTIPLYHPPR